MILNHPKRLLLADRGALIAQIYKDCKETNYLSEHVFRLYYSIKNEFVDLLRGNVQINVKRDIANF